MEGINDWSFGPINNAKTDIYVNGEKIYNPQEIQIKANFTNEKISVKINMEIENVSDKTIVLGKCLLMSCDQDTSIMLSKNHGDYKVLCQSGWALSNRILKASSFDTMISKTMGLIHCPHSKNNLILGFITFDRMNTEIIYRYDSQNGLKIDCVCDFDGYELKPGKKVISETLYISNGKEYFSLLEDWANMVKDIYMPQFREKPSIGWIGSWQFKDVFSKGIYEDNLIKNIDAINERLKGFEIENIWISIANLLDFIPGNWLLENKELFPRGLRWIVEMLKNHNMKLGLWMAPFWIPDKFTDHFENQKEQILKKNGEYVKEAKGFRFGESGRLPEGERLGFYCRDGSHPKALEYIKDIFEAYRQMGIRYYMCDFLWAGSGSTPGAFIYDEYYDKSLIKGPHVYRKLLEAIRKAAGEDTYILSSTGPTFQNIGLVDGVRAAPDFGEGRPFIKGFYEYPATYTLMNWELVKTVAVNYSTTFYTDKKFYHNDAFNMLTVDKPIPLNEARISASLFALSGGPIMLGDEIYEISDERLKIIKQCLPQYDSNAYPVDLFESDDYPRVFCLDIDKGFDNWKIIGVLNLENDCLKQIISLGDDEYEIFDFWDEMYMGRHNGSFIAVVPPKSIKIYRICAVRKHPWVLTTDMHLTQGGVEISNLSWDERSMALKINLERPIDEKGTLYIVCSKEYIPKNYNDFHVTKVFGTDTLIITKPVLFENPVIILNIEFERTDC